MEGHDVEHAGTTPEETSPQDDLALQALVSDLERELTVRRRQRLRHTVWAFLGVSPVAVLPLLGLLGAGGSISIGVLIAMGLGVTLVEAWRAGKAGKEVHALEVRLWELKTGETYQERK